MSGNGLRVKSEASASPSGSESLPSDRSDVIGSMDSIVARRPPLRQGRSGRQLRSSTPGHPAGEDAAAEERPFERPVAVHPAATEAGHLTGGVQARQGAAVVAQHAG